jgi:hypothetical protein
MREQQQQKIKCEYNNIAQSVGYSKNYLIKQITNKIKMK